MYVVPHPISPLPSSFHPILTFALPGGGMPTSTNRTKWPVRGGAIALQPGWFQGHATAFFYINIGFGEVPLNMSFNMVPAFQIVGPTKDPYPGTFCLPQVPLPANTTVRPGDKATIQVIETAVHGAALYNVCVIASHFSSPYSSQSPDFPTSLAAQKNRDTTATLGLRKANPTKQSQSHGC